jgi:MFS family permease
MTMPPKRSPKGKPFCISVAAGRKVVRNSVFLLVFTNTASRERDMAQHSEAGNWRQALSGNVFALGLVSFFTDFSSEMIYPLLPVFFTGLVAPATAAVYIGLMDGLAESVSSLLKMYSGRLSDRLGRRKALALVGYGISSLGRPLTALAMAGWHVVALRFVDRVGKGIRTSPRDAMLSRSVAPGMRGLAFSFHRMMDHAGAVAGPVVAMAFLYLHLGRSLLWHQGNGAAGPEEMQALRWLFGLALLPALAALAALKTGVTETAPGSGAAEGGGPEEGDLLWTPRFALYLSSVTLFALGNSSDLFLIFYARTRFGLGLGYMIVLWVFLHLAKVVFSLPGGRFADRFGRRLAILLGWLIYVLIYLALPRVGSFGPVWLLLLVYGLYYGLTEGAERALVSDYAPVGHWGQAYGWYHGMVGLAALPASLLFGLFWAELGARTAFTISAVLAAAAALVLAVLQWRTTPGKA